MIANETQRAIKSAAHDVIHGTPPERIAAGGAYAKIYADLKSSDRHRASHIYRMALGAETKIKERRNNE